MNTVDTPILAAWGWAGATVDPIETGHINRTFKVSHEGCCYLLQRLNPIFGAEVHRDIEAITARLDAAGLETPRLIPTGAGNLWLHHEDREIWRAMSWIEGVNHDRAESPILCESAGKLVARFHHALSDFDHVFHNRRSGVHDTALHLAGLRAALEHHGGHAAHVDVFLLAEEIFERLDELPSLEGLPPRIVHGDLKLSNIMFSPGGEAIALIDLDTLALMSVPVELGDALRSWCNPTGESSAEPVFCRPHYEASLRGYAEVAGKSLGSAEIDAIPAAVETITLELSSRFLRDTLEESYFGWDAQHYASAWEHNLLRGRCQLALARSIAQQRRELIAVTQEIFS